MGREGKGSLELKSDLLDLGGEGSQRVRHELCVIRK